jgi:glycosyltransferase involved in cell wall biosynthesis
VKIVHVVNSADRSTLGVERQVAYLAMAQKARGCDVMIAVDQEGVFTETCREHEILVTVRSSLAVPGRPEDDSVTDFIGILRSFSADVVQCHSLPAAGLGIISGNRMNIPCLFDNGAGIIPPKGTGLRYAILVHTASVYEDLPKRAPEAEVYYVPLGTKARPRTEAQETSSGKSADLIFVGSLEPRKGADIAILAMVELRRKLGGNCPILNIYGNGDQRDYLTEMTGVLELNDVVRFHGFKRDVLEQCPSTDILVMSSRSETGPLVVLEAMSRGMPIVATAVGEVTSMLPDQRYGRVIPPNSVVALIEAIESLLSDIAAGQFDPDLLIERHGSLYSLEKWAERMDAVYNQVRLNESLGASPGPFAVSLSRASTRSNRRAR